MTKSWKEKLEEVRADKDAVEIALDLHIIINGHLAYCFHKRTCPEASMLDEAVRIVNFAKEQGK